MRRLEDAGVTVSGGRSSCRPPRRCGRRRRVVDAGREQVLRRGDAGGTGADDAHPWPGEGLPVQCSCSSVASTFAQPLRPVGNLGPARGRRTRRIGVLVTSPSASTHGLPPQLRISSARGPGPPPARPPRAAPPPAGPPWKSVAAPRLEARRVPPLVGATAAVVGAMVVYYSVQRGAPGHPPRRRLGAAAPDRGLHRRPGARGRVLRRAAQGRALRAHPEAAGPGVHRLGGHELLRPRRASTGSGRCAPRSRPCSRSPPAPAACRAARPSPSRRRRRSSSRAEGFEEATQRSGSARARSARPSSRAGWRRRFDKEEIL